MMVNRDEENYETAFDKTGKAKGRQPCVTIG
jgi:hypothetical protein